MKKNRLIALILALGVLAAAFVIPASATEAEAAQEIEIIFLDETLPQETKDRIIAYYTENPDGEDDGVAPCNILCDLLGHKLESTDIRSVVHKYRATAPRCQQKTSRYTFCTRCDYETSTLLNTEYICWTSFYNINSNRSTCMHYIMCTFINKLYCTAPIAN